MENTGLSPAVDEFIHALREEFGDDVQDVWLFGSRARGDHRAESDYDFLIVVAGSRASTRARVAVLENSILSQYGSVFAGVVYPPDLWQRAKHAPLGRTVLREGRKLV